MSEKRNVENEDYQFIREKIATQKKSRVKRWFISGCVVVALAIVFGFVARVTFVKSERFVQILAGITSTPAPTMSGENVKIPSTSPGATNLPLVSDTPIPTPHDAEITQTPGGTEAPTLAPAGITDVAVFYNQIKDIAGSAMKSMAKLELVDVSNDWFGESIENTEITSGVIIGASGDNLIILTGSTKALEADRIDITVGDVKVNNAQVFASNDEYGLVTIKVPLMYFDAEAKSKIKYATFGDSSSLETGFPLIAIGNANGYYGAFNLTMVTNLCDKVYVTDNCLDFYNVGMSENSTLDGIFINLNGEIMGLVSHDFKDNMNTTVTTFVGVNNMKTMIEKLANGRPWNQFGVVAKDTPANVLDSLGLKNGLYVTEVKQNSPAEKAGLKKGNIIISVADQEVSSVSDFNSILNSLAAGTQVKVLILNSSKQKETLTVTIKSGM